MKISGVFGTELFLNVESFFFINVHVLIFFNFVALDLGHGMLKWQGKLSHLVSENILKRQPV